MPQSHISILILFEKTINRTEIIDTREVALEQLPSDLSRNLNRAENELFFTIPEYQLSLY